MKQLLYIAMFLLAVNLSMAQLPKVSSGKIIRWENMSADGITGRNVDIWLPADYNEKTKYNVLYMNDGQMLFDGSISWNKQEWKVDEWMTALVRLKKIRNTIVVGIWNNGKYRHAEYYPEKSLHTWIRIWPIILSPLIWRESHWQINILSSLSKC